MVISIDVPLKASEEATVKFLLGIVFGSHKKLGLQSNRRECFRHDVLQASKLIQWILSNERKNRRSLSIACNLVYGNTIVLSTQVARLLQDAIRAREIVAFTSYLAEEDERKRKTREQMEGDNSKTPKKKRRTMVEEFPLTPTPISVALKQNITMPDVLSLHKNDQINVEDDLAAPTMEQLEMMYGMLESENRNTAIDLTFIDRYSSNDCRQNVHNLNLETDFQRPSDDFIRSQLMTPTKSIPQEEEFQPATHLKEMLLFRQLPITLDETERRRSMEEEMEEARNSGINTEFIPPQQMDVPRLVSENMDLDDEVSIPIRIPKVPLSATKKQTSENEGAEEGINYKIPLREMHHIMEDYSSLHFKDPEPLYRKTSKVMNLKELLNPIPYFLRKGCNTDMWDLFKVKTRKFDSTIGHDVSDTEEEDEDEETERRNRLKAELEPLETIDLSQMKFMTTPLKDKSPILTPVHRPEEIEFREELELPRFEQFEPMNVNPISPKMEEPALFEDNWNSKPTWSNTSSENIADALTIRGNIIRQLDDKSPFEVTLDSMIPVAATSRREAARTFYTVLELLKERKIKATQRAPYENIDLLLSTDDSEDIDDLAMADF
ncbi:Rad21/Rec8-like protein C-terminal eukaryotic domain-containing protein [Caenorhabditis elegans]|uniref:Rad21/Rec8-like protein C-terminal eukaryotic domain-containing protein n=1 Tax=Caenorhabditis elegans TaxID=6239 RepID=Q19232_CAEEL|nr:Rad21/Rec8-like protein C-terminal eukaryotic domain-containing protein [Caenorhabditis elegans]CAB01150.2 Rad21/Rec8-like protein C-terminal eukaryotic domain-containing protein [Caenorhabditis elegans]|eukprot:NP_506583.2 COHesin family [Caenorhabditis elegans]